MTELHAHLINMKNSNGTVAVHHTCRKKFIDTRKRSSDYSDGSTGKKLRSSTYGAQETAGSFDWKSYCFLCSEKADAKNNIRKPIKTVQTLPIRENLIQKAKYRNDDWGNQVLGRLLTCNDLVAEEAIYHDSCRKRFTQFTPCSEKRERPINSEMMEAYEKVCNWLENDSDCDLYALKELHEKMKGLGENCEVYSIKRLKQKLLERYKDNIYFAQMSGRENVICFRNMADKI